jgi:hypothetical protein
VHYVGLSGVPPPFSPTTLSVGSSGCRRGGGGGSVAILVGLELAMAGTCLDMASLLFVGQDRR